MVPEVEDFAWQFHNLKGDTLSERKNNFFRLLRKENLFTNEEQLNISLKKLQPKTYLENLLYIDTLIYFKRTSELLEILKQGNEIFISKILKQSWFFVTAFQNISAKELVDELLPCLSFRMRMKVLKRLSMNLNEFVIDEIFECVLQRYGLCIASHILHACSSSKILEHLSNNEIKLEPRQVKILLDKNWSLFSYYLEYHKDTFGSVYINSNVFQYAAVKNPKDFLQLEKSNKLHGGHLGRRTSNKIMDIVRDEVVINPEYYIKLLKSSIVVRKLHGSFKKIYCNLFPRKLNDIHSYNSCHELLKFYPKKGQWDLFTQTFSQIFQDTNILDILKSLDYEIVSMCPDKKIIYKWGEILYNDNNFNPKYLRYIEPEKAFGIIKERINVTSKMSDRQDMLEVMVRCCQENDDLDMLEKFLKYFCFRHRNEDLYFREFFLQITGICFKLERFSATHWKYINEQIDIILIERENNYLYSDLLPKKYIEFLFKNSKPFKEDIVRYIKINMALYKNSFLLKIENPSIEQQILIQIANILPEVVSIDHKNYKQVYEQLLSDLIQFSMDNKEHFIKLQDFSYLINYVNSPVSEINDMHKVVSYVARYNAYFPQNGIIDNAKLIEIILADSTNSDFHFWMLIEEFVTKNNRSSFENEILQTYFEKIIDKHISHNVNFWFMKHEPLVIYPYFDKIINKILSLDILYHISTRHLKGIKYYTHFSFDIKLIDVFKKQLTDPSCDRYKIMDYLFCLATTEDLIKIIEEYFLPQKEKLDLQDNEMKTVYRSQTLVAGSLKRVIDPYRMLSIVLKFCVGDYLQSCLPSLYSIFYRSPEKYLYVHTEFLSKKAVSVRKHALFLSCELLNTQHAINMLKPTGEMNISSQKHRLSATLKYFVKNPSDELFDLLILYMKVIDKNDKETMENLTSFFIPRKYIVVYIEKTWQVLENISKEHKVVEYLNAFLKKILDSPHILLNLSPEFCKNTIDLYLKQKEGFPSNIHRFACSVLRYREAERITIFNSVFEILSSYKSDNENKRIKEFFESFYEVASNNVDNSFIKLFYEYWSHLFTTIEAFYEFTLISLLILKSDSGESNQNYAEKVVTFLEDLTAQYGPYVYYKFKNALFRALSYDFKEIDIFLFLYHMLKFNTTVPNCILVLDILQKYYYSLSEVAVNNILEILKHVEDPVVKIYYNSAKFDDIY